MAVPFQISRGSTRSRESEGCLRNASRALLQEARVPRLGVLLVTLVAAGAFVGVGHAGDIVAPEDGSASTPEAVAGGAPSADVSPPETLTEPPAESPPPDASTEPPAESPPPDASTEPPAESPPPDASTEPPAESPPPDASTEPPAESPPPDASTEPPAESPPPDASTEPPAESPPVDTAAAAETSTEGAAPSPHEGSLVGLGFDTSPAGLSIPLPGLRDAIFVPSDKKGSASGEAATRAGTSARSGKAPGTLRGVFMPGRAPASSPASGASSGSAPGSSGAGFALAPEFVLPLLAMLCCAFGLTFALPHSRAFALRTERPG
jgi:hypothetical protein